MENLYARDFNPEFFQTTCVNCGYVFSYLAPDNPNFRRLHAGVNYRVLCDSCGVKESKKEYASTHGERGQEWEKQTGTLIDARRIARKQAHAAIKTLTNKRELTFAYQAIQTEKRAVFAMLSASLDARYKTNDETQKQVLQGNSNLLACFREAITTREQIYFNALESERIRARLLPRLMGIQRIGLDFGSIKFGNKTFDDATGIHFAVFPAYVCDDDAIAASEFYPQSAFPGQAFASRATIQRTRTRVMVSQRYGLDI